MNIHPLFVHFPIALLTVYAIMELIRGKKFAKNISWFYIKFLLVALGAVTGFFALETGSAARHLLGSSGRNPAISVHEFWAQATILFFAGLAGCYLLAWLKKYEFRFLPALGAFGGKLWKTLIWIQELCAESWFAVILAGIGLVGLIITGALGGYIVYGANSDAISLFIAHLVAGL